MGQLAQALTPQPDITPPERVGQSLSHAACTVASIPAVHRSLEGFALVAGCKHVASLEPGHMTCPSNWLAPFAYH
jgi:hypothetical protein